MGWTLVSMKNMGSLLALNLNLAGLRGGKAVVLFFVLYWTKSESDLIEVPVSPLANSAKQSLNSESTSCQHWFSPIKPCRMLTCYHLYDTLSIVCLEGTCVRQWYVFHDVHPNVRKLVSDRMDPRRMQRRLTHLCQVVVGV